MGSYKMMVSSWLQRTGVILMMFMFKNGLSSPTFQPAQRTMSSQLLTELVTRVEKLEADHVNDETRLANLERRVNQLESSSDSSNTGSLMAIGGHNGTHISSVEVLSTSCNFPLPEARSGHISVTTADGKTLVCGGATPSGFTASCLQFDSQSKTWEQHSSLKSSYRYSSSAIAFNQGVYILGGTADIIRSSEFLATGSSEWIPGPTIPGRGVQQSCAAKLSDTEFVILGGWYDYDSTQALVYSTTRKQWREWPRLSRAVRGPSCVTLGNMILMAGGYSNAGGYTTRTFLFDTKSGSAREVASLKYHRVSAAMEVIGGRAVILGGTDGSGIHDWTDIHEYRSDGEVWNMDTETWEEADIHLNIGRSFFSLVAMDEDICE